MSIAEIDATFKEMIRAAQEAASGAADMNPEEAAKLESAVLAAVSDVVSGEPGSYPDDLPHRLALGLIGIAMGTQHQIDWENETATWEG